MRRRQDLEREFGQRHPVARYGELELGGERHRWLRGRDAPGRLDGEVRGDEAGADQGGPALHLEGHLGGADHLLLDLAGDDLAPEPVDPTDRERPVVARERLVVEHLQGGAVGELLLHERIEEVESRDRPLGHGASVGLAFERLHRRRP